MCHPAPLLLGQGLGAVFPVVVVGVVADALVQLLLSGEIVGRFGRGGVLGWSHGRHRVDLDSRRCRSPWPCTSLLNEQERILAMAESLSPGLAKLLADDDPAVFQLLRPQGRSACLLTCDHAGRAIPRRLGQLSLGDAELATHVAWDLGVAELGRRLAARLDAVLLLQNYSRLVIDANRPPGVSDSIPVLSERTRIPANEKLTAEQIRQRVEEVFEPYHRRLAEELDRRAVRGHSTVLVALHTFTPLFMDERRPWQVGVLYGRDSRLGRLMHDRLRRDRALVVGDNQPYAVGDESDYTILVHGEQRGIPHVELEVRQDLLDHQAGLEAWTERLAGALEACLPALIGNAAGSPRQVG